MSTNNLRPASLPRVSPAAGLPRPTVELLLTFSIQLRHSLFVAGSRRFVLPLIYSAFSFFSSLPPGLALPTFSPHCGMPTSERISKPNLGQHSDCNLRLQSAPRPILHLNDDMLAEYSPRSRKQPNFGVQGR